MVGYVKGNRMRGIDISIFTRKYQKIAGPSQLRPTLLVKKYTQPVEDLQPAISWPVAQVPVTQVPAAQVAEAQVQELPVAQVQEQSVVQVPHEIVHASKKTDRKIVTKTRGAGMKIEPAVKKIPITSANLQDLDICTICQCVMSVDCHRIAMSCNICGFTQALVDPNSLMQATPYYNLEKKDTLLSHSRLRKLRDYMKHVFSKHKSVVPMQLLVDISKSLTTKMGITSWSELQFHHVTTLLESETSLKKFECYKMQIYCRLKGCSPPQLHPEQEEALVVLFVAIQGPFERLKKSEKSTFFTMSYVFYVLCKFLDYDDILKYISIKRTRSKLQTQQALLKSIFDELNWGPFPFI